MELKVGDIVEFKNWEYMADNESKYFVGCFSPESGKITEIRNNGFFLIEDHKHVFNPKSIAKIISDADVDYCFIVQENFYGMYIGWAGALVSDEYRAKIYASRDDVDADAADMHLNAWDVIPYDD